MQALIPHEKLVTIFIFSLNLIQITHLIYDLSILDAWFEQSCLQSIKFLGLVIVFHADCAACLFCVSNVCSSRSLACDSWSSTWVRTMMLQASPSTICRNYRIHQNSISPHSSLLRVLCFNWSLNLDALHLCCYFQDLGSQNVLPVEPTNCAQGYNCTTSPQGPPATEGIWANTKTCWMDKQLLWLHTSNLKLCCKCSKAMNYAVCTIKGTSASKQHLQW